MTVDEQASPRGNNGFEGSDGEAGSAHPPRSPLGRLVASFASYVGAGSRSAVVDAWDSANRARPVITYGDIVPSEPEAASLDQDAWFSEATGSKSAEPERDTYVQGSDVGRASRSLGQRRGTTDPTVPGSRGTVSQTRGASAMGNTAVRTLVAGGPASEDGCPALHGTSGERPRPSVDSGHAMIDLEELGIIPSGSVPYQGLQRRLSGSNDINRRSRTFAHGPERNEVDSDGSIVLSQSAPAAPSEGLRNALAETNTSRTSGDRDSGQRGRTQAPVVSPSLVWRKLEQYLGQRSPRSSPSHDPGTGSELSHASIRGNVAEGSLSEPTAAAGHVYCADSGLEEHQTDQDFARWSTDVQPDAGRSPDRRAVLPITPVTPPIDIALSKHPQTYAEAVGSEIAAELAASHARLHSGAQIPSNRAPKTAPEAPKSMKETESVSRRSHMQRAAKATEQYRDLWLYSTGI